MFHHVAHALPARLLWCRDLDGLALFEGLAGAFPELIAVCLMPDHVHLILPHADPDNRLHRVYAGYAHGLCVRRGIRGPLFAPRPAPVSIPNELHLRRTVRYVHLNPCRDHLVRDPLAWPFSTHRDMCGFSARPAVATVGDPAAFHRYVSADDTVNTAGSALPLAPFEAVTVERLASAVASVFRAPEEALFSRTPARRAFVRAAATLELSASDVAAFSGLTVDHRTRLAASAPARGSRLGDPVLSACVRAAADPRFTAPTLDDHRRERTWGRYAGRR